MVKLSIGLRSSVEFHRVVLGVIEEFTVVGVAVVVVLGLLDIEVGDPTQLTKNISFETHLGVLRDAGALDVVLFVGVKLSARRNSYVFLSSEWFVEKFLSRIEN